MTAVDIDVGGKGAQHDHVRLAGSAPVASANVVSPSATVWIGQIGAHDAVAGELREQRHLRLCERRVGGNHRERRVAARCWSSRACSNQRTDVLEAAALRFANAGDDFPVGGIDDVAERVRDDQRGDDRAVGSRGRRRCRRRPSSRD